MSAPLERREVGSVTAATPKVVRLCSSCGGVPPPSALARRRLGEDVDELPVILVIEDEYAIQGIVEDALTEGGFAADILASGEEALTCSGPGSKTTKRSSPTWP